MDEKKPTRRSFWSRRSKSKAERIKRAKSRPETKREKSSKPYNPFDLRTVTEKLLEAGVHTPRVFTSDERKEYLEDYFLLDKKYYKYLSPGDKIAYDRKATGFSRGGYFIRKHSISGQERFYLRPFKSSNNSYSINPNDMVAIYKKIGCNSTKIDIMMLLDEIKKIQENISDKKPIRSNDTVRYSDLDISD